MGDEELEGSRRAMTVTTTTTTTMIVAMPTSEEEIRETSGRGKEERRG